MNKDNKIDDCSDQFLERQEIYMGQLCNWVNLEVLHTHVRMILIVLMERHLLEW